MTAQNLIWLLLAGLATGVLGAVLGTGGGVFVIPFLVLVLSVPMHNAVATSIITVIATSSAVASANVERGTANMRLGMTLEIATALGAICGGLTARLVPAEWLMRLFALVLGLTTMAMWRGRTGHELTMPAADWPGPLSGAGPTGGVAPAPPAPVPTVSGEIEDSRSADLGVLGARYYDEAEARPVAYRVRRLPAGLLVSFVAGNLSGLLGIGGGVFKVPALHLLCEVPIKAAAATSNFMIGVTAVASAFIYYGRGEVRPGLTAAVVLGVLAGSVLGSILNRWVRGRTVQRLFAVLLLAVAVQMFWRSFSVVR